MNSEHEREYGPSDVSVVVCTRNSIVSISACLQSLRDAHVGEVIVVDASSSDGTREVANQFADVVLTDHGEGLGAARNLGIGQSTLPFILNMGSDNILPPMQLQRMLHCLRQGSYCGVGARTLIEGRSFGSRGLNLWREGRFIPGTARVIGTPSLFVGDLLRKHPYDSSRKFSDDSELCERWSRELNCNFAISDAFVHEIGKTEWHEIQVRAVMYGVSDYEVFTSGKRAGWNTRRQVLSVLHPLQVDFLGPLLHLSPDKALRAVPFLTAFTLLRYRSWIQHATKRSLRFP